jgi:hypothetical protein
LPPNTWRLIVEALIGEMVVALVALVCVKASAMIEEWEIGDLL